MCKEEEKDMEKTMERKDYKKLNLNHEKINSISVTPKVKDGKLLFNENNKDHRYIVEDDL